MPCTLCDCVQGVPLDAETIAAGVLLEAVVNQHLSIALVKQRLGMGVANLLQDIIKVRRLPSRVDLYDDVASRCALCTGACTKLLAENPVPSIERIA